MWQISEAMSGKPKDESNHCWEQISSRKLGPFRMPFALELGKPVLPRGGVPPRWGPSASARLASAMLLSRALWDVCRILANVH